MSLNTSLFAKSLVTEVRRCLGKLKRRQSPGCSRLCVETTCLVQRNGHSGSEIENMLCSRELIHN